MSITVHERPGVYSSYDASSLVSGRGSGRLVGLAAVNTVAAPGETHIITSYDRAVAAFGSEGAEGMAELIRLALKNGASGVAAVATADEAGYKAAFAQLSEVEDIAVVLCDSTDTEIQKLLLDSVKAASADRRERLALLAGAKGESVDDLIDRAKGLNSERAVLVAPGGLDQEGEDISGLTVAAAVAGALAGESDPDPSGRSGTAWTVRPGGPLWRKGPGPAYPGGRYPGRAGRRHSQRGTGCDHPDCHRGCGGPHLAGPGHHSGGGRRDPIPAPSAGGQVSKSQKHTPEPRRDPSPGSAGVGAKAVQGDYHWL